MSNEVGNYAQIASAAIALVAVVVAGIAWRLNLLTFRTSFRPVVRPVPFIDAVGGLVKTSLVLKNYGRGAAFSVMLFEDSAVFHDAYPIAMTSVVETLGSGPSESERLGRIELTLFAGQALIDGRRYRLLYQDVGGHVHETEFTVNPVAFVVKFLGTRLVEDIPNKLRLFAMVVGPEAR